MSLNCGIVGLPNVGKSTFFNALTATQAAQAANFPFCTIEPNTGRVAVPDERLDKIAALAKSERVVPTQLEFVDIAGLVRGASKGEGLGNQFLANIREVDAILHVLRCFEDDDITHVEGSVDPLRDADIIETELMLADMESLEKRIPALTKRVRGNDVEAKQQLRLMEDALKVLQDGKPARTIRVDKDDEKAFQHLQLLTARPIIYVCNVEEDAAATGNAFSKQVAERAKTEGTEAIVICAAIEAEIAQLTDAEEKAVFLNDLGLEESGLNRVIRAGYKRLHLMTYFTAGPKETRAWTITAGTKAPQAAGVIHTDFERGFIKAETTGWEDYVALGGESLCKEAGKTRQEGKDYIVRDGDIMLFKFNV